MPEPRDRKLDLLALGLMALCIFLGASLLSYDPADSPSRLVYPVNAKVANMCGRLGAYAAWMTFNALGIGAYYLLVSLAVCDIFLLGRRDVDGPLVRLTGWLLSLAGLCTLAAMALPRLSPGPVIGSGGYLGAAVCGLLERNFATIGAYIVALSLVAGGLLLCTDYVLFKMIAVAVGLPVRGLGRGAVRVGMAYASRAGRRRSDLDPLEVEEALPANRKVKITRPKSDAVAAADEDDDEEDEDEADEAAAPEANAVRVRKPVKGRHELLDEIEAATTESPAEDYELPEVDLLLPSEPMRFEEQEKDVRRKARILEKTFADFGFNVRVVEIQTGPVIAQFEVELEAGLRLSRITGLADDLAVALRVPSVRIVAPLPGKNTVGIEVPNTERQLVRLREVMEETAGKIGSMRIPIYLGKDVAGSPMVVDLTTLPHLLIAGRTGTGKSVCLNSIIVSILMSRRPDEVRTLLIDPKMVELSPYKNIPHLMHPVVTDMRKAEAILAWAVEKMEERYALLARAGVRHISVYNQLGEDELMDRMQPIDDHERREIPRQLPYIVIVADEMADLMMTAAKEVEGHIIRLAQKSRAVGIHLVLATQKPTVDVITGLIKSNLPARICFQVASRVDSRVVLDEMGADKLLGNGDMLFLWPGTSTMLRGQGTFLSDDEIARVIDSVATTEPQYVKELVQLKASEPGDDGKPTDHKDEMFDDAVDVVVREGRGSVSLLQRALGIGYGRAARLIDFMAEDGIVGAYNGSQAREVLVSAEDWQRMRSQGSAVAPVQPPRPAGRLLIAPAAATHVVRDLARPGRRYDDDRDDEDEDAQDSYGDEDEDEDGEDDEDRDDGDEDDSDIDDEDRSDIDDEADAEEEDSLDDEDEEATGEDEEDEDDGEEDEDDADGAPFDADEEDESDDEEEAAAEGDEDQPEDLDNGSPDHRPAGPQPRKRRA